MFGLESASLVLEVLERVVITFVLLEQIRELLRGCLRLEIKNIIRWGPIITKDLMLSSF